MPKKQTPKVLVFDDTVGEYAKLRPRLEGAGYRPVHAQTREEFAKYSPWTQFALIIIDMFVGDSSGPAVGIDLTREVHRRNPKVPIIVSSTWEPMRDQVAESFRAGARDYIDKDILLENVDDVLNRYVREAGEAWLKDAEDELPLPMAFLLRDLRRYKSSPRQRLERMIELFEVTLKMISFAMISAQRARIEELPHDLREAFARPSLGHFSRVIDAIPSPNGLIHAIAEAAHRPRFREITGSLTRVRNDFIGHGGLQSDAMYEKQVDAHEPEILELLRSLDAFRAMRLVRLGPPAIVDGKQQYETSIFAGSNPEPELGTASFDSGLLDTSKVYFTDESRNEVLGMDPFCQYLVCERCLRHKLFLYRLARQGELWMIDHVYGHSIQTRSGWDTYRRILGC
jgi:CheY-like chemotaxis protein